MGGWGVRNILVTGGTGFIGSAIVQKLVSQKYNVRVFDNNFRGNTVNIKNILHDVDYFRGDIRNLYDVEKAVTGIDTVFHLAFINGTENFYKYPDLVLDVGIRGHLNIMDACNNASVDTFIYASSSEVYQTPQIIPTPEDVPGSIPDVTNPRYSYGGAKLTGELLTIHYLVQSEMRRIIFRPHNIFGPAMGFEHVIPQIIKKIMKNSNKLKDSKAEIEIQGTGDETRAFCFIDDAVSAIMLLSQKGQDKDIFHVGVNSETKIIDIIKTIASLLEVEISVRPSPLQNGSTPRRCPDISKLISLGYRPACSLLHSLETTVDWYKNYYLTNEMELS